MFEYNSPKVVDVQQVEERREDGPLRKCVRGYASWCFSRFVEGQDSAELPDLERLPGREAEVDDVHRLLSRS